jgi:hypothetical protein
MIFLISHIHRALKTFGFFHGIRKILITSVYKRLTDPVMADHVYAKSSYGYVEKFYKKHNCSFSFMRPENDIGKNDFIYWTCWLQGLEAAPALVRACINSAAKHAKGYTVIVITYENLDTFVTLPPFIFEKHKRGFIAPPQFTDILRTYLLFTYGGVWFDSTVFFTARIPGNLVKQPLFFFKSPLDDIYCPVSNWFIISAERNNLLLFRELCALCEYWRINTKLFDYFIYHYFLQVIINTDAESSGLFHKIPYRSNQNPHYLQKKLLFTGFNRELWELVKNVSFCHKLTYKKPEVKKDKEPDTFFSHIVTAPGAGSKF